MKRLFYLLLILLFISSCSKNRGLNNENDIENINLEINDIIIDSSERDLIDETTDEDIDELIDILFETNGD